MLSYYSVQFLVIFCIHILNCVICMSLIPNSLMSYSGRAYPELSSDLYQGDLLLPSIETNGRNAVILDKYKWPGGIVRYKFTSNYTDDERDRVRASMDKIESNTCVKFHSLNDTEDDKEVDGINDNNYILINKIRNRGCSAVAGYRSDISPIPVNFMPPACFKSSGTIQHELLHVLGLLHEQARPDRDDHVKVMWENIDERHKSDFGKAPKSAVTTYGVPYDFYSVMHYPNMAFSKNGRPTLVSKKNPNLIFGQREGATEGDFEKVRQMYNCVK